MSIRFVLPFFEYYINSRFISQFMNIKNSTILSVVSKGLSTLVVFGIVVLTARMYGKAGRGEISLFTANYTFILHFCSIIGGSGLVYLYHKKSLKKMIFYSYLWTIGVCFLAFLVLLFFYSFQISHVILVVVTSFLVASTQIHSNILLANQKLVAYNTIKTAQSLILIGILVFDYYFLITQSNTIFFMIYTLISFFITAILSYFYVQNIISLQKKETQKTFETMFKYGINGQISNIFQFICYRATFYWIEYFYQKHEELGVFAVAVMIAESVWVVSSSIATMQYAKIANSTSDKFSRIYTNQLQIWVLGATILLLFILIIIPEILWMNILKVEFSGIKMLLICLSPGILAQAVSRMHTHYFSGKGNYTLNNYSAILGAFSAVISGFICIYFWGVNGAAISMSFSYILVLVFTTFQYKTVRFNQINQ